MFKSSAQTARLIILVFAVGVVFLVHQDWFTHSSLWQRGEGLLLDWRYADRLGSPHHERGLDSDIQLVGIQASTLSLDALSPAEIAASPVLLQMNRPWPWNREVYAAVLDRLFEAGARVVALDITFSGPNNGDAALAAALEKYKGRVVIASTFLQEEATYLSPSSALGSQDLVGFTTLFKDGDEIARHGLYQVSWDRGTNLMNMSALAVKKFAGSVQLPPYDRDNLIDFQGPPGTYEAVPLEKIFLDWNTPPIRGGILFSNKIVIVGSMAEVMHDIHDTAVGSMAGPEIQAHMMATLLRNSSIKDLPRSSANALTLLMVTLAVVICILTRSAIREALALAGVAVVFYLASRLAFTDYGIAFPMMSPLFGLLATGAFGIVCQYSLAQYERARYRNVLDRYVSKNVAQVILEDHRSFDESLIGKKLAVTTMFCDIRGFTYLSASTEPEELVAQLNEYFQEMVGIVYAEAGTLSKFIGDAFLAIWGDTHSEGEKADALRAVRAALKMRAALVDLNAKWEHQPDRIRLSFGVGINHGEAIVGQIGHPQRMEFTALGDGVNLASRLDAAAKQYQVDILVSESVEALTREHFVYRLVDRLAILGRNAHVDVYTVLEKASQPPPWLAKYHRAVQLYRRREFAEAASHFKAVMEEQGGADFLCEMYIQRCLVFVQNPPPPDWDGSSQWGKSSE